MENTDPKDTTPTPTTTPPGAVMDIQPPRPVTTAPQVSDDASTSASEVVEAPVEEQDAQAEKTVEIAESSVDSTSVPAVAAASSEHPLTPNPLAIPEIPAHTAKKSAPIVPIVVAVLIALALAAVTIFAYLKTPDTTKTTTTNTTTKTTPLAGQKITQEDVDAENKKLEEDLKAVNEDTDFAATDLSDQSLGL